MDALYSLVYIGLLLSTFLWFFLYEKKRSKTIVTTIFLICLTAYLPFFLLRDGSILVKLFVVLPRDIVLFLVSVFTVSAACLALL